MKSLANAGLTLAISLLFIAAIAPNLIALGHAVVLPVIVLTVAAVVLRLVFFHTRRW